MQMGGIAVACDRFTWGRGLLHAAIPVLVLIAAGLTAALAGWFPSAKAAGQAVGVAAVLVFAGALVASWLLQTGRRGCGLSGFAAVALFTLAVVAGVLAFPLLIRLHPSALTAEDKRFPEVYWDLEGQRFRHPSLGFSLPAPTERFAEAPAMAEQMRAGLAGIGTWAWAWQDPSTQEAILVLLTKGSGGDRKAFEEHCGEIKEALASEVDAEVVRDEVRWDDGRGDYLVQSLIQGRVHFDTRCISGRPGEATTYVACVMTIAGEPTWSRRFLAGLEAAPTG